MQSLKTYLRLCDLYLYSGNSKQKSWHFPDWASLNHAPFPWLQIDWLCKSVHQTLSHLSTSQWIWSAMMLQPVTSQAHHTRWSGTKTDRKWPCVETCSCCTTPHFTLSHCCPLMLDSTSVRPLCLHSSRRECSAWDIFSTVSIHEVEHSWRNKGRRVHIYRTFSSFLVDPWNVSISGPDAVFPGRLSKFTCLTSCTLNVDCTVRWQFRAGFPIGTYLSVHENELKWTPSIPGTFQNFTCVAENAAAGQSAEATKTVEVKGTDPSWEFALVPALSHHCHISW